MGESSQSMGGDGSICCFSLHAEGGGRGRRPSDLSLLKESAEWTDAEAWASSIIRHGTQIVFHGLLGQVVYDQQDPNSACLWRHGSFGNTHPSCSRASIHFPIQPSNSLLQLPFCLPYHCSSKPSFPEGVDRRCDGMMSHQCSPVSVDDCQLGLTLHL